MILELARNYGKGPVKTWEIARRQDISQKYLEQIVIPLIKSGLVTSVRGAKGGYILAVPPEDLTLGRIVRLLEEKSDLIACLGNPVRCQRAPDCQARLAWMAANSAFYQQLDSMTVASILDQECQDGAEK